MIHLSMYICYNVNIQHLFAVYKLFHVWENINIIIWNCLFKLFIWYLVSVFVYISIWFYCLMPKYRPWEIHCIVSTLFIIYNKILLLMVTCTKAGPWCTITTFYLFNVLDFLKFLDLPTFLSQKDKKNYEFM